MVVFKERDVYNRKILIGNNFIRKGRDIHGHKRAEKIAET